MKEYRELDSLQLIDLIKELNDIFCANRPSGVKQSKLLTKMFKVSKHFPNENWGYTARKVDLQLKSELVRRIIVKEDIIEIKK